MLGTMEGSTGRGQQDRIVAASAHPSAITKEAGKAKGAAPSSEHPAPWWDWKRMSACGQGAGSGPVRGSTARYSLGMAGPCGWAKVRLQQQLTYRAVTELETVVLQHLWAATDSPRLRRNGALCHGQGWEKTPGSGPLQL